MRKGLDRRIEDPAEFTGGQHLTINFSRKQIRIAHWKPQQFLRAHGFTLALDIELYHLSHFVRFTTMMPVPPEGIPSRQV